MDVKEILALVSDLSIGLDEPTASDMAIYLKYLNLVHNELFRKVAAFNPKVPITREELNANDGILPALQSFPSLIRSIYQKDKNKSLVSSSFDRILGYDPGLVNNGDPQFWYFSENKICVSPKYTGVIGVVYVPSPESLTLDTLSDDIPYPALYHSVLVDGTCYYLFQGEDGFKDQVKMQSAIIRWEKGQNELIAFLGNLSGQSNYSTYSSF
jgi:hypothetical protein